MIVGRARKAKLIIAGWNPTSGMKDLNKKSPPASEKLISLEIALSRKPKIGLPIGVLKINKET